MSLSGYKSSTRWLYNSVSLKIIQVQEDTFFFFFFSAANIHLKFLIIMLFLSCQPPVSNKSLLGNFC